MTLKSVASSLDSVRPGGTRNVRGRLKGGGLRGVRILAGSLLGGVPAALNFDGPMLGLSKFCVRLCLLLLQGILATWRTAWRRRQEMVLLLGACRISIPNRTESARAEVRRVYLRRTPKVGAPELFTTGRGITSVNNSSAAVVGGGCRARANRFK